MTDFTTLNVEAQKLVDAALAADAIIDAAQLQAALDADAAADAVVLAAKDATIAAGVAALAAKQAELDAYKASHPDGPDTVAPLAPTGLTATVVSSTQINLVWNAASDNVGVVGYNVYRGYSLIGTPIGTSFSHSGLTPATSYSYTVKARDAAGNLSPNSASVTATTSAVTPPPVTGWPDATNTGHTNAPGYPGSLTPGPATLTANTTYSFMDFDGATVNVPGVTFIGCRFRSNWLDGWNIRIDFTGTAPATFKYCTICPMITTLPDPKWPSGGAGKNVDGTTGGGFEPYMIPHNSGYQYGIFNWSGPIVVENCDMWGFGNAIPLFGSWQKTIRNSWIHDAAAEGTGSGMYHTDGPGHLDGSGCSNVLIEGNTIASLGNTNGIAFQAGTYTNVIVRGNYLSGFGYCVDMGHATTANSGLEFTNNVIGTDIGWHWGPIYTDFTANFTKPTNLWRGNKVKFTPGYVARPSSDNKIVASDDGKFILPSGARSTVDFE